MNRSTIAIFIDQQTGCVLRRRLLHNQTLFALINGTVCLHQKLLFRVAKLQAFATLNQMHIWCMHALVQGTSYRSMCMHHIAWHWGENWLEQIQSLRQRQMAQVLVIQIHYIKDNQARRGLNSCHQTKIQDTIIAILPQWRRRHLEIQDFWHQCSYP